MLWTLSCSRLRAPPPLARAVEGEPSARLSCVTALSQQQQCFSRTFFAFVFVLCSSFTLKVLPLSALSHKVWPLSSFATIRERRSGSTSNRNRNEDCGCAQRGRGARAKERERTRDQSRREPDVKARRERAVCSAPGDGGETERRLWRRAERGGHGGWTCRGRDGKAKLAESCREPPQVRDRRAESGEWHGGTDSYTKYILHYYYVLVCACLCGLWSVLECNVGSVTCVRVCVCGLSLSLSL